MSDEHDEALIERVALALRDSWYSATNMAKHEPSEQDMLHWKHEARAVIYPPVPPKTRLQVARELLAAAYRSESMSDAARAGSYDNDADMRAVLAALALPAMED